MIDIIYNLSQHYDLSGLILNIFSALLSTKDESTVPYTIMSLANTATGAVWSLDKKSASVLIGTTGFFDGDAIYEAEAYYVDTEIEIYAEEQEIQFHVGRDKVDMVMSYAELYERHRMVETGLKSFRVPVVWYSSIVPQSIGIIDLKPKEPMDRERAREFFETISHTNLPSYLRGRFLMDDYIESLLNGLNEVLNPAAWKDMIDDGWADGYYYLAYDIVSHIHKNLTGKEWHCYIEEVYLFFVLARGTAKPLESMIKERYPMITVEAHNNKLTVTSRGVSILLELIRAFDTLFLLRNGVNGIVMVDPYLSFAPY